MGRKIYHSNSRGKSNLKFIETKLKGAYVIEIEKNEDERGFFARIFERKRFSELGLDTELFQCNISFNKQKGTLRGMHYQDLPYGEVKIVRCTRGKIFDVIIDLRAGYQITEIARIGFIINNLLNREYMSRPANMMPPRTFAMQLALKI